MIREAIATPRQLLAKTPRPGEPFERFTLVAHSRHVTDAAEAIIESVGTEALAALGLGQRSWAPILRRIVVAGAGLHDIGKANDNFLAMLLKKDPQLQAIRHEVVPLVLAYANDGFSRWLKALLFDDEERLLVLAIVAFHHLKYNKARNWGIAGGRPITIFLSHPDLVAAVSNLASRLNVREVLPSLADATFSASDTRTRVLDAREEFHDALEGLWRGLSPHHPYRRLLPLAKHLVAAADGAGSAAVKQDDSSLPGAITYYVTSALARRCEVEELDELIDSSLAGHNPHDFQRQVAYEETRFVIARAGCGSGKTLAAWLWVRRHAVGRKVVFAYPTTGTATEGFAGYVAPNEIEGRLIHSRAEIDIEALDSSGDDLGSDAARDEEARWEAFGSWSAAAIVTTVDAVLGLLQNQPRSLYASPALLSAAYVFDEVHAYDDKLFGLLLRFLDVMSGTPILLMTASLPENRLAAIRRIVPSAVVVEGPNERESLPRYRLREATLDDAIGLATQTLHAGGKVLWISNTVARARAAARNFRAQGSAPYLYHSRFRYEDRARIHRAAIDAFTKPGATLLVATQVAEMSLDLSADLLVSELAPISALIQRIGRLNRREAANGAKLALLIDVREPAPYSDAELANARAWLQLLGDGDLSQRDLAIAFETVVPGGDIAVPSDCRWLDDVVEARPDAVRDDGYTVSVIMCSDARRAADHPKGIRRLIHETSIPMIVNRDLIGDMRTWRRLNGVPIAPEDRIHYDPTEGATWAS